MDSKIDSLRKMINKQSSFLADDDNNVLKEYTIMKLDELLHRYEVSLNGHGTSEWYADLIDLVKEGENPAIYEHLRAIEGIPYPTKFKEDVKKLVVKFCIA